MSRMLRVALHVASFVCIGSFLLAAPLAALAAPPGKDLPGASIPNDNVIDPGSDRLQLQGPFDLIDADVAHAGRAFRSSGAGASFATYQPQVATRGFYRVYLWWPQSVAGSGIADVTVQSLAGSVRLPLDQRVLGGQWNPIGVYELDRASTVQLSSRPGSALVADALRVEFLGTSRPALAIADPDIPILGANVAFSGKLEASGGFAPYFWIVGKGTLPPGLALDIHGNLAGTPSAIGHYEITLRAFDSSGQIADAPLALDVVSSIPQDSPGAAKAATARIAPAASAGVVAKDTGAPDLSGLIGVIAGMPEGQWAKVNLNNYSDVWAPADLRPLKGLSNPTPGVIILAWSSFAWDTNSGRLWLYGGGHANYSGNDVYYWDGTTRLWHRASLPSEVFQDDLGNWNAIDGADHAPASAHTYDNNIFFPILNRLVAFGGAAYNNGGAYLREVTPTTSRRTGPYLFDPTRADPNKVGGTTGSHVKRVAPHPEVLGGNMWQNRDLYVNLPAGTPLPATHVNGCTGYAVEGGRDVAYVAANSGSTALALYRYVINDVNDPSKDSWTQMGRYWNAGADQPACGYDPIRKVFVRTGFTGGNPFAYWSLQNPGPTNNDALVTPTDPTGEFPTLLTSGSVRPRQCGLDFDSVRNQFALWCGDGRVWMVTPPAAPVTPNGWTIVKQPVPTGAVPTGDTGTGIIGKWKYIENIDAYIGLQDPVAGNIWLYKPVGWHNPGGGVTNARPSIAITSPAVGTSFAIGDPIDIDTAATDSDGSVTLVEFFNNGVKIGQTTTAPFSFTWTGAPAGTASLTALATDNAGGQTLSVSVPVTVIAGSSGTVVLQDGQNGYTGTRDTYLDSYHPSLNLGAQRTELSQRNLYTDLFRFAIFAREGGPVPDGATIVSATLSLYKGSSYDMVFSVHRMLQDWIEGSATWSQRAPGVAWNAPGAMGADTDYRSTADAQGSVGWYPAWVQFDVTGAVTAMATGENNFGWQVHGVSGNVTNGKSFFTREYLVDPTLRPKLAIVYSGS